ncbi:MAG TPA: hypothetical protein VJL88_00715 [Nitrospira sp.]|nr:hypothetical protein [Nitrospira sp.]
MQFDPALAAQTAFRDAEQELGPDWPTAVELEEIFSSSAGREASDAYEALLSLAQRHPDAHAFQAFCIYMTWQQATEETIARHFHTGLRLCDRYLNAHTGKHLEHFDHVEELRESFRTGLGMEEDDELQTEYRRDTPKGGD